MNRPDTTPAELTAVLFDQRELWHRGERRMVETLIADRPTLSSDREALLDLIYHEYVLREGRGESPKTEEYLARFPEMTDELQAQFEVHEALAADPAAAAVATAVGEFPAIPGYEILGRIGRGGAGVVYRARHEKLHRDVALKMILADEYASQAERNRLLREAKAVANLRHPHIVQVHDFGEAPSTGDGPSRHYFTLELVEHGSLDRQMDGTPQPPKPSAKLVENLARTMDFVHRKGIVHCDLKPANVLLVPRDDRVESVALTDDPVPKITDFGFARNMNPDAASRSTQVLGGTWTYMAPEQARGSVGEIGPASDVYALGVILYEIVTGRAPFWAASAPEMALQILDADPLPPSRLNPQVPRDLDTICLKCLEKSPAKRYASAGELAEDLRRFQAGEPIVARPIGPVSRRPVVPS